MNTIYVVGLGPGHEGLITLETWQLLTSSMPLFLRTHIHPSVDALYKEEIPFTDFDGLYDTLDDFEIVYTSIVDALIRESEKHPIVYAVPGSPLVAERTVQLLIQGQREGRCSIQIVPGMSFLEVLYTKLELDPIDGLFIDDCSHVETMGALPDGTLVLTQLYNRPLASTIKLALMEHLEDETEVKLVHHLSLPEERIITLPLYELDRFEKVDHLTTLIVPKEAVRHSKERDKSALGIPMESLCDVVATLRGPAGCPWDQKQTHDSLRRYLLEEAYELLEAIDKKDMENVCEELGDVLLQVVFHARLAEEKGYFSMDDVVRGVTEKMRRRHPHVFGNVDIETMEQLTVMWDEIKEKEKGEKRKSVMDGIPPHLPALLRAEKIQERAKKVGFNWDTVEKIWDKLDEEILEFKEAIKEDNNKNAEKEGGDILFCLINILLWYKISGENALRKANSRFLCRFTFVEEQVRKSGSSWSDFTLSALDEWWKMAKMLEKD